MNSREEEIRKTQEIIINDNIIDTAVAESELHEKTKKTRKRNLIGIVIVIINVILVIVLGFTTFNKDTSGESVATFGTTFKLWMSKENILFWFIALGLGILALFAEAMKFFVMIRTTTHKNKFGLSLKAAIMGKYYDNITPLGSGGQPFQIFYLSKGGVPSAEAMYLPTASFFLNQFAFLILCVVSLIFFSNSKLIANSSFSTTFLILAYLGAAFSILLPTLIFIVSFMPRLRAKIIKISVRISYKFKFVKNKGAATRKANKLVNDYKRSLFLLAKSKGTLLIISFLSFVYQISICSIPYFVIRACGVPADNVNYFEIVCVCAMVYAAISFIPTPGNSGAAEGISFTIIFSAVNGFASQYWTMAFWRFCCYFLWIIIGIGFVIGGMIKTNTKRKKELKVEKEKLEAKKASLE